jgi:5'-nucleotidase
VQPYVVLKKAGKRIGVIGLLTDVSTVVERKVADKLKYLNPIEAANRYAEYLKNEKKCDLIICLSHLGYGRGEHTDCEIAPHLRNVDIIVGGHSHTNLDDYTAVKDLDGKEVVIVQDGSWGLEIGQLTVNF